MAPCHAPGRAEHSNSQRAAMPPKGSRGQGTPGILQTAQKPRSAQSLGMVSSGFSTQLDPIHRMEERAQRSCRINGDFTGGIAELVDLSKVDDFEDLFQPKGFCGLRQVWLKQQWVVRRDSVAGMGKGRWEWSWDPAAISGGSGTDMAFAENLMNLLSISPISCRFCGSSDLVPGNSVWISPSVPSQYDGKGQSAGLEQENCFRGINPKRIWVVQGSSTISSLCQGGSRLQCHFSAERTAMENPAGKGSRLGNTQNPLHSSVFLWIHPTLL